MKVIGLLFFLLFCYFVNGQKGYSIDELLEYLKRIGYFDIIQEVKRSFGPDIAIDVCKALIKNNDCEIIVRVYMSDNGILPKTIDQTKFEFKEIYPSEKFIQTIQNLFSTNDSKTNYLIYIIVKNYNILIRTMTEKEILMLIKKMISYNYSIKK